MHSKLAYSTQSRIISLVVIMSLSFLTGQIILNRNESKRFDKVIRERAAEKNDIFQQADSVLRKSLYSFAYDYSYWDDMLKFVSNPSAEWAHTNIEVSLETFKCQAAWVSDRNLELVYSYNLLNDSALKEFPADRKQLLHKIRQNKFYNFFIHTSRGLMEIQCAPIQTGTDAARITEPGGYLLIGKLWDQHYLTTLKKLSASSDIKIRTSLAGFPIQDSIITDELAVIYRRNLNGWDGRPAAILETVTEFPMMNEFLKSIKMKFMQTILFSAALIIVITLYLLISVGKPLRKIAISVESGDSSIITELTKSKSEFGKLAKLITLFFRQKETLIKEIEDRKKAQTELQNKVTRLQLIKALHNAFIGALDINQIIMRVNELIPFYLGQQGIQNAKLLLYNAEKQMLVSSLETELYTENTSEAIDYIDPVDKEICSRCFTSGLPVIVNDCSASQVVSVKYAEQNGLKSVIALPVVSNHIVIGVIRLDNMLNTGGFSFSDIELFSMISEQLGIVIHNAQLFKEQKNIEEALRTSEEKYRTIFENTGTASVIVEEDTTVSLVNAEWVRLSGYSREEIEGKAKWIDYVHPEDLPRLLEYHKKRRIEVNEEVPSRYELRMLTKKGEPRDLILTIGMIPGSKKSIVSLYDITERKRTENELLKFSYAVEQTPVSVIITGVDGSIEYVNPRFEKQTGYSYSEVIGQNPRLLKSGETTGQEYKKLWETISSGGEWRGEFHNRKKNGDLFWEFSSISPIKNKEGKIIHYVAMKEDITEWKQIEKELTDAKTRAENSDKLKSEFLAQMSHEIRTPINTILSFTGLISEVVESSADQEMRDCFVSIRLAGKRIIRTIDLLLNMSEIQTGSYEKIPKQLDVQNDILQPIYMEFLLPAKDKGLILEFVKDPGNCYITADEYSVYQVFVNLVENAIKYTNRGNITISVYHNEEGGITVEVADTGIGINKDFLPKIFRPFSQEEQGYSRKFEGNGLGLALVSYYCEINNASIEVESEKDKGTKFRVNFQPE